MKRLFLVVSILCMASVACGVSLITKPYTFTDGTKAEAGKVNANFDTAYTGTNAAITAINTAAGTRNTLDSRLDISMNDDGTMKSNITAGGEWINPGFSKYSSSTTSAFKISGDQTSIYLAKRRLKAGLTGGTVYTEVAASTYNVGTGYTTISTADAVLSGAITSVEHSTLTPISATSSLSDNMLNATTTSTGSTLVKRDASGNFSAGTITAALSGNAATATNATNHIAAATGAEHGATTANTANMIVRRDASGNFSAGTITANIVGNVSGSSGSTTGNAATATNVAYSGLTGTVPTWNQNTTGNAATATNATNATNATYATYLNGQLGSYYQPASTAITTGNIASQSVNYANSAGRAYPYRSDGTAISFVWSGFPGTPTYMWGSDDGVNMYVWQPANISVNYANSANSATYATYLNGQLGTYYQPASTAITTSNIASQSVNYANSANSATSASSATNSTATGTIPYTRYENGLRIIRGAISYTGGIDNGSGFTINKLGTGMYAVNFANVFSSQPTVIASPSSGIPAGRVLPIGVTTNTIDMRTYGYNNATATDGGFSFIAIGPD